MKNDLATGLEAIKKRPVASSKDPVYSIIMLTAGPVVDIRIPQAWSTSHSVVESTISRKEWSDDVFTIVCKTRNLAADPSKTIFEISDPWSPSSTVWRIELRISIPDKTVQSSELIEVFRKPTGEKDDDVIARSDEPWNTARGYLCSSGKFIDSSKRPKGGFGGKILLDVSIDNSLGILSKDQLSMVKSTVLRAVGLWAQACPQCEADHLAVVKINGNRFVQPGLNEWYNEEFVQSAPTEPKRSLRQLDLSLWSALERSTNLNTQLTRKYLRDYQAIPAEPATFQKLCALHVDAKKQTTLWGIQQALCDDNNLPSSRRAGILVRFTLGRTACGDDKNIIACRADNELTEYNARDYSFGFDSAQPPPIGNGLTQVELLQVILHEMGHWIGLPHFSQGQSIMAPSLATSRCIDDVTASAITSYGSKSQPEAFHGPSAFTLRPDKRSHRASQPTPVKEQP